MILASLSLGTVGSAYIANISKYKPIFVVITIGLLYWAYTVMEKSNPNKTTKIIFWASAVISLLLMYYPVLARIFG